MSKLDYRDPEWVADQLGIDKNTVYKFLHDGTIPALQLGRKWLISETRLIEWLESQTARQTADRRGATASAEATSRRMTNYTPEAREVIRTAHAEARRYNHDYLGQEHLILGITSESKSVAARTLTDLGVKLDELRGIVEARITPGESAPSRARLARSPECRKAMRLARKEAGALSSNQIGTEHLLLGILNAGEGPGFELLAEAGITFDAARQKVEQLIGENA